MLEDTYKRFDEQTKRIKEQTRQMSQEAEAGRHKLDLALQEIEAKFEKKMDSLFTKYMVTTVSILGSLIVIVGAVSSFSHALIH